MSQEASFETWPEATPKARSLIWQRVGLLLGASVALAVVVAFAGLLMLIYREARSMDVTPTGAVVVLGAAQFNGVPSAVYQARLDTAAELYRRGVAPLVVVTGGRQPGDQFTEAESGRDYLVAMGLPAADILVANTGSNTEESLESAARLLEARGIDEVTLVSDGFHLYRAQLMASDAGLSPNAHAAEQSPIEQGSLLELRYVLREAAAVAAYLAT